MEGLAQECFPASQTLLFWLQPQFNLVAPEAPEPFTVQLEDALFTADATPAPGSRRLQRIETNCSFGRRRSFSASSQRPLSFEHFPRYPETQAGGLLLGPPGLIRTLST